MSKLQEQARAYFFRYLGLAAWTLAVAGSVFLLVLLAYIAWIFGLWQVAVAKRPGVEELGLIVSLLAVFVSVMLLAAEKRREVVLLRYEAVRSKRSTAKAIRAEIEAIRKSKRASRDVLLANASDIGRLNRATSQAIMNFYLGLPTNGETIGQEEPLGATDAIRSIDEFLGSTLDERDRLHYQLRL